MKQLILMSACVTATSFAFGQAQCVNTAVNLSGNQLTLTTTGAKSTTLRQNYVYYERKRMKKNEEAVVLPDVMAKYPSEPLLLNSSEDVKAVPEKYSVSVATPQENISACADSNVDLAATLTVERMVSYTGNYPVTKTEVNYRKVSKRTYKMAARKKRKIERKEEKIARRANVNVEVKSTAA